MPGFFYTIVLPRHLHLKAKFLEEVLASESFSSGGKSVFRVVHPHLQAIFIWLGFLEVSLKSVVFKRFLKRGECVSPDWWEFRLGAKALARVQSVQPNLIHKSNVQFVQFQHKMYKMSNSKKSISAQSNLIQNHYNIFHEKLKYKPKNSYIFMFFSILYVHVFFTM